MVGGDFPSRWRDVHVGAQGRQIKDQCGKTSTLGAASVDTFTKTTFTTNALKLTGVTGAAEPGNKIQIGFNQYMDIATFTAADFDITPGACQ